MFPCRWPVFFAVLLFFAAFAILPALGAYDAGSVYAPAIGISSFFPSDVISIGPGGNGTVTAIVANGGNAKASNVSLSFGGTSCCNISASPTSADIPAFGSRNFTIAISAGGSTTAGAFVVTIAAKSLEGASLSSHLTITVLPMQTPANTPAPIQTPAPSKLCATCPMGWLPGENDDCTPPCPTGVNCPLSVMRCPSALPPAQCPQPTIYSCCTRTYSPTGCVPQDAPDNGRCSKNEYCSSEACVCLSNKCSSYKELDSCGENPQCGWCGGDGKCKQAYEVACQPAGCNGPALYCTKSCGWSMCPPVSSCVDGKCATSATPSGEPSTELEWGAWRPASAIIAGGDVTMTRDLIVRFKGTRKPGATGTAWRNYAKEMEDAGWKCVGADSIIPDSSGSPIQTVVNCTRSKLITAVQGGWLAAENGTIEVQRFFADVGGRNTDPTRSYGNVSVSAACLPSFSCAGQVLDALASGASYSVRLAAEGNAINLFRTRGVLPDGNNYTEIEVKNSLVSGLANIAGWLDFDGSMSSSRKLEVITGGSAMAITPASKCPQHDAFEADGLTWKSCESDFGRFEFIIPSLPAGGTVTVRAIGLSAKPSTAAAYPAVESMIFSYSSSEVLQNSAGAIIAQLPPQTPREAAMTPSPAEAITATSTTTEVPESATVATVPAVTTMTVPATIAATVAVTPTAAVVNSYVRTVESLSGIPLSTDPAAQKSIGEETAKASSAIYVERAITPSAGRSAVSVRLENRGAETLRNVVVFERIPKSVAQSADEVVMWRVNGMQRAPDRVVENDPVLAFVFEAVPAGKVDTIEYEVNKEVKSGGAKDYSAPVVLSYAVSEGVKGGETGAFSFFAVFQKWIGGWIFWLLAAFFSVVVVGSYLVYRWIRSKTD